jgi:hypothetical protein
VEELIKTLPMILRSIGDDPEVATAAAITAWRRAAGEGLRQHAVPITLTEGTLLVAVADAVWKRQLGYMIDQLLYKTNSILGQPLVKRVELIVDPRHVKPQPLKTDNPQSQAEVPLEISTAANAISDKHLRQTFVRAATGVLNRRQRDQH